MAAHFYYINMNAKTLPLLSAMTCNRRPSKCCFQSAPLAQPVQAHPGARGYLLCRVHHAWPRSMYWSMAACTMPGRRPHWKPGRMLRAFSNSSHTHDACDKQPACAVISNKRGTPLPQAPVPHLQQTSMLCVVSMDLRLLRSPGALSSLCMDRTDSTWTSS